MQADVCSNLIVYKAFKGKRKIINFASHNVSGLLPVVFHSEYTVFIFGRSMLVGQRPMKSLLPVRLSV